jgi:threonine synthase
VRVTLAGLACRECGAEFPAGPSHVCEDCFGPLRPRYPAPVISREVIAGRAPTMWRYAELLPVAPVVGQQTGMTPLVRADRLGARLGIRELWLKNEAVSHPTLSFKDRLVSVAISAARALDLKVIACASTGNLANATAALAAAADLPCVVLVPEGLEPAKIVATSVYGARVVAVRGTYDDVNRLSSEIADRRGWGFVNVNLKPYYAEGSKTVGYEIAEQLGWRLPAHVVVPMAGGSLLDKLDQAFAELRALGLASGTRPRMHGAQAAGCAPIVELVRKGGDRLVPVPAPRTIARSLAVGDPGDGYYARDAIVGSGGFASAPDDEEILAALRLLAETEGLFVEPGAAAAVAGAAALAREGRLDGDGPVVLCITGQGLKTTEALAGRLPPPLLVGASLDDFERSLAAAPAVRV